MSNATEFSKVFTLFKPHPWHGVHPGKWADDNSESSVMCFIECAPGEGMKYEVDKTTGYLMVDRPQRFSSVCPCLYGFVPQTYCGTNVAARCMERTGMVDICGDGDPIDVCVLSSKTITHGDLLLKAKPIGGLRMIDSSEADDKLVMVIEGDVIYSGYNDIKDLPVGCLLQIRHYFESYKSAPGQEHVRKNVIIPEIYGREEAWITLRASRQDYQSKFSSLQTSFFDGLVSAIAKNLPAKKEAEVEEDGEGAGGGEDSHSQKKRKIIK